MNSVHCLNDLQPGQSARVKALTAPDPMCRRLLDLGLTQGTRVTCVHESPAGDPRAFLIRGAVIALRAQDCRRILIE